MMKTYHGSCHCGAVRFRCAVDLAGGTSRCNCSMCWKGRFWKAIVPSAAFELLTGEESLAEYRFGTQSIRHRFCRHCGIKPYGDGELSASGGQFYAINLACLNDVPLDELLAAPIAHEDGRHDRWGDAPDEAPVL
jgi:hypothetical protein